MPQVNFRTSSELLAVIDRAAAMRGVSRTEFMLRSSEAAAIEVLNERPVIALDDEAWDDFVAALDAPGGNRPGREGELRAPAPVGPVGPPEPLATRHDISQFSLGRPPPSTPGSGARQGLNEARGGARTYVACDGDRVAGFLQPCRQLGGTGPGVVPGRPEHARPDPGHPSWDNSRWTRPTGAGASARTSCWTRWGVRSPPPA